MVCAICFRLKTLAHIIGISMSFKYNFMYSFSSSVVDLPVISFSLHPTSPNKTNTQRLRNSALFKFIIPFQGHMLFSSHPHNQPLYLQHQFHRHRPCLSRKPFQNSLPSLADHCSFFKCTFIILSGSCNHINISE